MQVSFKQGEINHHALKFMVGLIAISLSNLTEMLSAEGIASISASCHAGGWWRNIFVGLLFAIGSFLLAYNGTTVPQEAILAKVAAIATFCVAMFPCGCGGEDEIIPYVHYVSAAVTFVVLAAFCAIFCKRARAKATRKASWRASVYAICGGIIVVSILVLTMDFISKDALSDW